MTSQGNKLRIFLLFLVPFETLSPDMRIGVVKETKYDNEESSLLGCGTV
jgi:hypothetical protein